MLFENMKPYFTLCRISISLFAACSAATGYFLAPYHSLAGVLGPAAAVFLLVCGASALNQCQERDIDAKMERTRQRPLPSGHITPTRALSLSLALILAGQVLLASGEGRGAFVLGLVAIAWYNGIYTYSKKVTAFASVPGAAVGMIPPAIGWISAGGEIADVRLAAICLIFFLWQVPHFWLLLLNHGEEYERAGLPSLTKAMSKTQIARITFAWIVAAATAGLALPLYGSVRTPLVYCSFILSAAWLIWNGRSLTKQQPYLFPVPVLFRKINIYLFLIMSLLSLESIFLRMP
jgi:protoheme IX farnesyltransferase